LLDEVHQFGGANHFDPNGQSPFTYAIVLLCCGRFGDAIAYIWSRGKTLPAVHLTVGCLHYGLILPHVPLTHNPFVADTSIGQSSGPTDSSSSNTLTPSMLFNYFYNDSFQQVYPEVALEYLMCLHIPSSFPNTVPFNKAQAHSIWQRFVSGVINKDVVETHEIKCRATFMATLEHYLALLGYAQLRKICGDIPGEGLKLTGALHDYSELPREEIQLLLARVAFNCLTVRGDSKRAVHFFKLCGRFTEALTEICQQFSSFLCSEENSAEREFWVQTATHFYSTHINVGSSEALNVLRSDGREDLATCLRQLLDVYKFVSFFRGRKFDEALLAIDATGLLPRSVNDVQICLQPFIGARNASSSALTGPFSYFRCLLNVIDDVVINAIICCQELAAQMNESLALSRAQFALQSSKLAQLNALKERSRALVAFVVQSPEQVFKLETRSLVTKMEFAN
jgi:hypothetical protein